MVDINRGKCIIDFEDIEKMNKHIKRIVLNKVMAKRINVKGSPVCR